MKQKTGMRSPIVAEWSERRAPGEDSTDGVSDQVWRTIESGSDRLTSSLSSCTRGVGLIVIGESLVRRNLRYALLWVFQFLRLEQVGQAARWG